MTKEQYFALYLGQPIFYNESVSGDRKEDTLKSFHLDELNNEYKEVVLSLRSISQLTDEEAHKLAVLAFYHPTIEDFQPDDVWIGEGDINPDGSTWLEVGCRCWEGTLKMSPTYNFSLLMTDDEKEQPIYNQLSCTDYLRSIGINLSTEAITNGWCILKEGGL